MTEVTLDETSQLFEDQVALEQTLVRACQDDVSVECFHSALKDCLSFASDALWLRVYKVLNPPTMFREFRNVWLKNHLLFENTPLLSLSNLPSSSRFPLTELLERACHKGNLDAVRYLLTDPKTIKKCDVHYRNETPLNLAFQGEHLEVMKFLLESDLIADHAQFSSIQTHENCLLGAAARGLLEMTKYLATLYPEDNTKGVNILIDWNHEKMLDQIFYDLSEHQKQHAVDEILKINISLETIPLIKSFVEKTQMTDQLAQGGVFDQAVTLKRKL